ncbi:MAG: hypothetical protein ACRCYN_04320 [Plesiomonas sp.]
MSALTGLLSTLKQLITNPASGRLSTSDTTLVGAFMVSSFVLLWCALFQQMQDWLFIGYLGAWVAQSQASKHVALKRDKDINHAEP